MNEQVNERNRCMATETSLCEDNGQGLAVSARSYSRREVLARCP